MSAKVNVSEASVDKEKGNPEIVKIAEQAIGKLNNIENGVKKLRFSMNALEEIGSTIRHSQESFKEIKTSKGAIPGGDIEDLKLSASDRSVALERSSVIPVDEKTTIKRINDLIDEVNNAAFAAINSELKGQGNSFTR